MITVFIVWYIIGLISTVLFEIHNRGKLTVMDLVRAVALGILGLPLVVVIILIIIGEKEVYKK